MDQRQWAIGNRYDEETTEYYRGGRQTVRLYLKAQVVYFVYVKLAGDYYVRHLRHMYLHLLSGFYGGMFIVSCRDPLWNTWTDLYDGGNFSSGHTADPRIYCIVLMGGGNQQSLICERDIYGQF